MTPECERLGLAARLVENQVDIELLRLLRNACRLGFSHDTGEISEQAQHAWWVANKGRVRAWLYTAARQGLWESVVGFGVLRQTDDGRWWSSVGVHPDFAGRGYGGAITADLVRRSDERVWATARLDNPVAQRLHREADWEEWQRDERLAHYRTLPHVHMEEAKEEWAREGWVLT